MRRIGRRSLLAVFGATGAAMTLGSRMGAAQAVTSTAAVPPGRWFVDASLDARDIATLGVVAPTLLESDLVQQWQAGLRDALRAHRGGATGLVRWDKAFVLQGLAREEGMQVRVERLTPALFRVTLHARA